MKLTFFCDMSKFRSSYYYCCHWHLVYQAHSHRNKYCWFWLWYTQYKFFDAKIDILYSKRFFQCHFLLVTKYNRETFFPRIGKLSSPTIKQRIVGEILHSVQVLLSAREVVLMEDFMKFDDFSVCLSVAAFSQKLLVNIFGNLAKFFKEEIGKR